MEKTVENFLKFLATEKGFSPNTIAAYKNDLSQFAAFVTVQAAVKSSTTPWPAADRELILSYVLSIKERGYAPATVARKVAAIKAFSDYLVHQGIWKRDPTKDVSGPKMEKSVPKTISMAEVDKLLQQPPPTLEGQRDRAMLELLCATGMRVSELVSLNVDDINLTNPSARCLGRKGKKREMAIPEQAVMALKDYLEKARPQLLAGGTEKALFLNRRGQRLTRQGFWFNLKHYAQKAGIETEIAPHILRHSVATHLLHSGQKNLSQLREFLGHANISTTKVYEQAYSGAR